MVSTSKIKLIHIFIYFSISFFVISCFPRLDKLDSHRLLEIKNLLCIAGVDESCSRSNDSTIEDGKVSIPVFSPNPGLYNISQNISIATDTSDSWICYTLDAGAPVCGVGNSCTNGTLFDTAFSILENTPTTLSAIGCSDLMENSDIATGSYTIDTIPPPSAISLTATAGDTEVNLSWSLPVDPDILGVRVIRRTDVFSVDPNDAGGIVVYEGPLSSAVDSGLSNGTDYYYSIFSYDAAGNFSSGVNAGAVATPMGGVLSAPLFNPPAGLFNTSQDVSLSATPIDAKICYSVTALDPECDAGLNCVDSIEFTTDINVSSTTTIKARACRLGNLNSGIASGTFTIDTIPPGEVTALNSTPGDGTVQITWTNPVDADFLSVSILRKEGAYPSGPSDGTAVIVYNGSGTSVLDSALTNGVTYFYSVYTLDLAGNYSAGSNFMAVPLPPPGSAVFGRSVVPTGSSIRSGFNAIASDDAGNVYAVGFQNHFFTSYDYGNGVVLVGPSGGENCVIVKYSPDGTALQGKTNTAGSSNCRFQGVAVDGAGDIYAVGVIMAAGSYTFGAGVSVTGTNTCTTSVIVKYNSALEAQWANAVTGVTPLGCSEFRSVALDGSGNPVVVGFQRGNVKMSYGNATPVELEGTEASNPHAVIVKYNGSDGGALWGRIVIGAGAGTKSSEFYSVAVDGNDLVIAVGSHNANDVDYDFGNSVISVGANSSLNGVVVQYDPAGIAQWTATATTAPNAFRWEAVAVDSSDNIILGGYVGSGGSFNFGSGVTINNTSIFANMALLKYDPSGTPIWARTTSDGGGIASITGISVDTANNIYIGGRINGNTSFDFGNGVTGGGVHTSTNVLTAKYDPSGMAQWISSTFSSTENSAILGIVANPNDDIFVVGTQDNTSPISYGSGVSITGYANVSNFTNAILLRYMP